MIRELTPIKQLAIVEPQAYIPKNIEIAIVVRNQATLKIPHPQHEPNVIIKKHRSCC